MTVALENNTMNIDSENYAFVTLSNIGENPIRILNQSPFVRIKNETGEIVHTWDSSGAPVYTKDDLIVLLPNQTLNYTQEVNINAYNFNGVGNFTVYATYESSDKCFLDDNHPPFWEGSLISNIELLDISKNVSKDIGFLLYYSTPSVENVSFDIIIITDGNEVFNQTVTPIPGRDIYCEKASGHEYYVKVRCNNETSEHIFIPNSQNALSLGYSYGNIGLQEVTD